LRFGAIFSDPDTDGEETKHGKAGEKEKWVVAVK
jgi:hypothetical protein